MTDTAAVEEGPTKAQIAKSISYAIQEKLQGHNHSLHVNVAFTPENEKGNFDWDSFVNPVKEKVVIELEVERGTLQQLTSNKRKCLQRPSKSCCVIIAYLAFICLLGGIFAMYEVNHARDTTTPTAPATTIPTTTTTTPPATLTPLATTTPATTKPVMLIKKDSGVTDAMVDFLKKHITVEGMTKIQLAKSISKAMKKKDDLDCFLLSEKQRVGNAPSQPIHSECGLAACTPCTPGSWNIIVASNSDDKDGKSVWNAFFHPVEQKYLKLQLGDQLYCEIWKVYARTPAIMTTTTITPATTTTYTTMTTPITTSRATPMQVAITKRLHGVTDDEVDFTVVVASAEEGMTKVQLAKSISDTMLKEWGRFWNVIVAFTPEYREDKDVWGSIVQLDDKLYFEIWKGRNN